MKNILIISALTLAFPFFVGAHGETANFGEIQTGPEMMRFIEDRALGEDLHEEMEDLMVKMMAGELTEAEAERITQLMEEYPGPQGMMMNRFMSTGLGRSGGMMNGMGLGFGAGNFWFGVSAFAVLVWLIVGILVIIWLWQQIARK